MLGGFRLVTVALGIPLSGREYHELRRKEYERIAREATALLHDVPYGMTTRAIAKQLKLAGRELIVARAISGSDDVFRANPDSPKQARWAHVRWVNNVAQWLGRDPQDLLRR